MTKEQIVEKFKAYVAHKLPDARNIDFGHFIQIFGGASRQTFRVELNYTIDGEQKSRLVILRCEFSSGIIETNTRTEWEAYRAYYDTEVPVPKLIWLEENYNPFFVMEEIVDCQSSIQLFNEPPYSAMRENIGETFCKIMGTIPKADPAKIGLEGILKKPKAEECWKKELDYWEADINNNELEPHPVLRAAIRWLRRNPPPPAQKVVVLHGDIRAGNFLFNEAGEIKAILDWEMMHMGDPIEDLAWSMNRLWTWSEPDLIGLMIPREKGIKIWEETSGFSAKPSSLFWWEVFTSVKSMAVWISMNRVYTTGENTDPIICYGGMWAMDIQRRILIQQMKKK